MSDYLVIQLARIGDLVQSKRLLLTLERLGRVHLALDRGLLDLAALLYPRAVLHPLRAHAGNAGGDSSPAATLTDNTAAFAELGRQNFAAVYNLNRSPLALAISGLFPPETVHGYRLDNGQPLCSNWSRLAARWTANRQSSPLNLVDFWAFFHPQVHEVVKPEEVNPQACAKNPFGREHALGVVLAGREARRSLPVDYLAACLEVLFTTRKGPRLLLLGGKSEQEAARKLCRRLKPATLQRVEDLSGKTSLRDLHEVLQGLDLVVTPDTGAMHLAAHLGTPVFATFLSSAWAWETGPYGMGHQIWQAWPPQPGCAPCLESAPCPHAVACLAPFADPLWLDRLANTNSDASSPSGLIELSSRLDALGVTYAEVNEVRTNEPGSGFARIQAARLAKRALVGEYLGLPAAGISKTPLPPEDLALAADALFDEADWMLPDYRVRSC
ncbi:MAG: glycosyltransferase family 9 protein [Deltaproteobacteria bacterium]|jgi:ADP-heptose:LPS heptosyltransferase|nr:glycosyltransferase family 9 protein [Deltaproteobacteria bacterium]